MSDETGLESISQGADNSDNKHTLLGKVARKAKGWRGHHKAEGSSQGVETEEPKNVNVNLAFGKHAIENSYELPVQEMLLKVRFGQMFHRGEKNIYLRESALADPGAEHVRQEAYKRFGKWLKVEAYQQIKTTGMQEEDITDDVLESYMATLKREYTLHPEDSPIAAFGWLESKVLDELNEDDQNEQAYNIQVIEETGIADVSTFIGEPQNASEYKEGMLKLAKILVDRDPQIATQLTELITFAEKQEEKTNIGAFFGTLHSGVIDLLPAPLQSVCNVNIDSASVSPDIAFIIEAFKSGKQVSEQQWEEIYSRTYGGDMRVQEDVDNEEDLEMRRQIEFERTKELLKLVDEEIKKKNGK